MDPVYLETLMKASLDEKRDLLNSTDRKKLADVAEAEEIKEEGKDALKLTEVPSSEILASSDGDYELDSQGEKKSNKNELSME